MIVNEYKGRGRTAAAQRPLRGGWLYRLFMRWFSHGRPGS